MANSAEAKSWAFVQQAAARLTNLANSHMQVFLMMKKTLLGAMDFAVITGLNPNAASSLFYLFINSPG